MAKVKVYRGRVHLFDRKLDQDELVVGRSAEAEIPLESPAASRKHVKIVRRKWNWYAESLGTKNPAMLNKRPFTMDKLKHGDTIVIAEHTLVFDYPRSEQVKERDLFEGRAGAAYRLGSVDIQDALDTGSVNEAKLDQARQSAVGVNATQMVDPNDLHKLMSQMEKRRGAHLVMAMSGKRLEFPLEGRTHDVGWTEGCSVHLPGTRLFGRTGARLVTTVDGRHRISASSKWVTVYIGGKPLEGDRILRDKDTVLLKHFLGFGTAKLKYEAAIAIGPQRRAAATRTAT
ncbi:MAG: FHA domain-containing protein [Deltaproteobacteria bacterium]|nr:FHA domain-containing protein [Deltaproteobacteria bacterium]